MKCDFFLVGILLSTTLFAVPEAGNVRVVQNGSHKATISYSLSSAPAVVTLDVQTNAPGGAWVSVTKEIGATNFTGDVWKRVETTSGTIDWNPVTSWPNVRLRNGAKLRAVVTAYAVDDTPDYMVVDLAQNSASRTNYYPSVELLPGGLFANEDYRKTKLVMRKVLAKDVPWIMGTSVEYSGFNQTTATASLSENNHAHPVALTNNFYMGVFELTQKQWETVKSLPTIVDGYRFTVQGDMRPINQAYFGLVRGDSNWPNAPVSSSFLGTLRTRTGIDFDLPSEAQWEFACRAGSADGEYNDGTRCSSSAKWWSKDGAANNWAIGQSVPGRYLFNGGWIAESETSYVKPTPATTGPENGPAIVGTAAQPNDWGFYDMHGNVCELTLDFYAEDISSLNGAVNSTASSYRVVRGGSFNSRDILDCRSAARSLVGYNTSDHSAEQYVYSNGYRLCCRNGLQ